jgi:thymidylate kinase
MIQENIILGFDGPDNVGKSTQIKKIRKYFKDIPFTVLNIEAPVGNNNEEKLKYGLENSRNNFKVLRGA